ncbi:MAG: hypothetical protein LBB38_01660, partial [Puniceicoccales bacterium]|nr:hypothetical protein [Puniceicoccales bacterium]
KLFAAYADGFIELLGTEHSMLTFKGGWHFSIDRSVATLPANSMVVLIRAQPDAGSDVIEGLSFEAHGTDFQSMLMAGNDTCGDVSLFRATDRISGLENGSALYWFENNQFNGLAFAPDWVTKIPAGGISSMQIPIATFAMDKRQALNALELAAMADCEGIYVGTAISTWRRGEDHLNPLSSKANFATVALAGGKKFSSGMLDLFASAYVAIGSGKTTYDGNVVDKMLNSKRREWAIGASLRHNIVSGNNLTTSASGSLALACGSVRGERKSGGNTYGSKFSDFAFRGDLCTSQGFIRFNSAEFSCFGGLCYDTIGQRRFSEKPQSTGATSCITVSSAHHNFLSTALGVAVENHLGDGLNIRGKLGWQWDALRRHGTISTAVHGFSHVVKPSYGDRHCAFISLEGTYPIKEIWDCRLAFDGNLSKKRRGCSIAAAAGRKF